MERSARMLGKKSRSWGGACDFLGRTGAAQRTTLIVCLLCYRGNRRLQSTLHNGLAVVPHPGHLFHQNEITHTSRDGSPFRNTSHDMFQMGQPGPIYYNSSESFSYLTRAPEPALPV